MNITVRAATDDDVEDIRRIGQATWPATYAFAGDDYVADGLDRWWSAASIRSSMQVTTTLVAEADGRVVGTGTIDLRFDPPIIWKLYVLPELHGRGIGSALLNAMIDAAPGRPVTLEYVDGNDHAAAFYARHGFVLTRTEPNDDPAWPAQVWATR